MKDKSLIEFIFLLTLLAKRSTNIDTVVLSGGDLNIKWLDVKREETNREIRIKENL